MIYKFQKNEDGSILELQLLSEKYVLINMFENSIDSEPHCICLDKKDIFHLIGALHLLQKQMQEL